MDFFLQLQYEEIKHLINILVCAQYRNRKLMKIKKTLGSLNCDKEIHYKKGNCDKIFSIKK